MTSSQCGVDAGALIAVFNGCFAAAEATVLVGGASEPFFAPGNPAQIHFREDFVSSALHEIAHWCVAGRCRRQIADYGYWYSPDGRLAAQQAAFFAVEARPQALESLFSDACGVAFSPSVDNVEGDIADSALHDFAARIDHWRSLFLIRGLPPRAAQFVQSLERAMAQDPIGQIVCNA